MLKTTFSLLLAVTSFTASAATYIAPIAESETITKLCKFGFHDECTVKTIPILANQDFILDITNFAVLAHETKQDTKTTSLGAMVFADKYSDDSVVLSHVKTLAEIDGKAFSSRTFDMEEAPLHIGDKVIINGYSVKYKGNKHFVLMNQSN